MVPASLRAADILSTEDVEVEVLDLRSLRPLDTACVVESVARTGRLVTAHESWVAGGIGAEVVAAVAEAGVPLRAAARVGTAAVPTPSGKVRPHALPSTERIVDAIRCVLRR
jgi:pyruvate dehydrogenase E1 component beta subunit